MAETMRLGGMGTIDEGKLKGRQFIIPNVVFVQKQGDEYARACLKHEQFIPDQGCPKCEKEARDANSQ